MGAIEIDVDHPRLRVDTSRLETVVRRTLAGEGRDVTYLGIVLTGHDAVRRLNVTYLDHDFDTDVLSFPLEDPDQQADGGRTEALDGEVYVDLDTALERAPEFGVDFETEVFRYVVHGVLHLMGYDDATPEQKSEMHRLEDRYLQVD